MTGQKKKAYWHNAILPLYVMLNTGLVLWVIQALQSDLQVRDALKKTRQN